MLYQSLDQLGWFDPARPFTPIRFDSTSIPDQERIEMNTLGLVDSHDKETDLELGSDTVENRWTFYVDFYAENDALSLDVIGDIRDIVAGRHPSIGRTRPILTVYDYSLATPVSLFYCTFEDPFIDRGTGNKPWHRYWRTCRFEVVYYSGESTLGQVDAGSTSDDGETIDGGGP
jgi:hypothetical protein